MGWFYGVYQQILDVMFSGLLKIIYNNIFKAIKQVFDGLFHGNIYNRNKLGIIIM